jgi:hypothetical protein
LTRFAEGQRREREREEEEDGRETEREIINVY